MSKKKERPYSKHWDGGRLNYPSNSSWKDVKKHSHFRVAFIISTFNYVEHEKYGKRVKEFTHKFLGDHACMHPDTAGAALKELIELKYVEEIVPYCAETNTGGLYRISEDILTRFYNPEEIVTSVKEQYPPGKNWGGAPGKTSTLPEKTGEASRKKLDTLPEKTGGPSPKKPEHRSNSSINLLTNYSNHTHSDNQKSNVLDLLTSFGDTASKSVCDKISIKDRVGEVIGYLNKMAISKYDYSKSKYYTPTENILKEGYTVDDMKRVIDLRAGEWREGAKIKHLLEPMHIFGDKFDAHLNNTYSLPEVDSEQIVEIPDKKKEEDSAEETERKRQYALSIAHYEKCMKEKNEKWEREEMKNDK